MFQRIISRPIDIHHSPFTSIKESVLSSTHYVEELHEYYKLRGHRGCVNTILFSEDGHYAITGSDDMTIKFFDIFNGKCSYSMKTEHTNNIFYAKDLPFTSGENIASCAADGKVLLTLKSSGYAKVLHQHKGRAHRLALIPESSEQFYSCGEDGKCYFYDLRENGQPHHVVSLTHSMLKYRVPIYVLGLNPMRRNELALAGAMSRAMVYDIRMNNKCLEELAPSHLKHDHDVTITGLKYNYCGSEILLSYNDEDIYAMPTDGTSITSTSSKAPLPPDDLSCEGKEEASELPISSVKDAHVKNYSMKYSGHCNSQTVKQVNYMGPESEWVISGSDCGHVFIWDSKTGKVVKLIYADNDGAINCLTPHTELPILATAGLEDDAKLWAPRGFKGKTAKKKERKAGGDCGEEEEEERKIAEDAYLIEVVRRNQRTRERHQGQFVNILDILAWIQSRRYGGGRGDNAEGDDDDDDDSDEHHEDEEDSDDDEDDEEEDDDASATEDDDEERKEEVEDDPTSLGRRNRSRRDDDESSALALELCERYIRQRRRDGDVHSSSNNNSSSSSESENEGRCRYEQVQVNPHSSDSEDYNNEAYDSAMEEENEKDK